MNIRRGYALALPAARKSVLKAFGKGNVRALKMAKFAVGQLLLVASCCGCLLFTGCPSSVPPGSSAKGSSGSKPATEANHGEFKEDPDDVAALKAAKATLSTDSDGHIIAVQLSSDSGSDQDLAHVKGLPYVRELGAEARGVTDAGLVKLEGHPNLRTLSLERAT